MKKYDCVRHLNTGRVGFVNKQTKDCCEVIFGDEQGCCAVLPKLELVPATQDEVCELIISNMSKEELDELIGDSGPSLH